MTPGRLGTSAAMALGLAAALSLCGLWLALNSWAVPLVADLGSVLNAAPELRVPALMALWQALGTAAVPEETSKLLATTALLLFLRRAPVTASSDSTFGARQAHTGKPLATPVTGAWRLGAALGLGFALSEAAVYALRIPAEDWGEWLIRLATALPCHVCLGVIMMHYAEKQRYLRAWSFACLLHAIYDYPVMAILAVSGTPQARSGDQASAVLLTLVVLAFLGAWTQALALRSGAKA